MNYGSIVRLRGHALLPNAPLDRFYLQTDAQIRIHRRARPGFLQVLTGQLVTKQMLFLGFSFTDPNIALLFASIREAFQENGPEHYAIVMRPKRAPAPAERSGSRPRRFVTRCGSKISSDTESSALRSMNMRRSMKSSKRWN
jgi:hypothetical protein